MSFLARRRAHMRQSVGMLAIAGMLGTGVLVAVRDRIATSDARVRPPAGHDDVLVFDDAYDGVVALDAGRQNVTRRPIPGQKAGDQPFRSLLVGNRLVVGWGDVYAAPLAGGRSRRLGRGVAVPAEEAGAVWLTSYGGVRTATERLVDMRGTVLAEGRTPSDTDGSYAAAGVRGGLIFAAPDGLAIWDARTSRIVRRLGTRGAEPGPVYGRTISWCAHACRSLELTILPDGTTRRVRVPVGAARFRVADASFSPDGARLAVPVEIDGGRTEVVVVDVGIAAVTARITGWAMPWVSVGWSPDGKRVYAAASDSGAPAATRLVVYDSATHSHDELGSSPGGAARFVVVSRAMARSILGDAPLVAPDACPPPRVQPSGRAGACAFRYD